MSFITPHITTIQNASSWWYYSVCRDERYEGLTETLDIPKPTTVRYMYYWCAAHNNNNTLKDCIRKGDGTPAQLENFYYTDRAAYNYTTLKDCIRKGDGTPAQLENLNCSDNMERYEESVPAFTYNAAVFPPYGDTIHHWYISKPSRHVSLITDSKKEIWNYINNGWAFNLNFVPLPDTQQ